MHRSLRGRDRKNLYKKRLQGDSRFTGVDAPEARNAEIVVERTTNGRESVAASWSIVAPAEATNP
jgi:adenylylsulfate kinase-like enzyme